MIELATDDFDYLIQNGRPYHGMKAIGDVGKVYEWDDLGAVFSLFGQVDFRKRRRRPKRKKIAKAKKIKPLLPKVIQAVKDGAVIKIKNKKIKAAIKAVTPVVESIAYWTKKLAPVAAILPGYGPVIAEAEKLKKVAKLKPKKKKKRRVRPLAKRRRREREERKQREALEKMLKERSKAIGRRI